MINVLEDKSILWYHVYDKTEEKIRVLGDYDDFFFSLHSISINTVIFRSVHYLFFHKTYTKFCSKVQNFVKTEHQVTA